MNKNRIFKNLTLIATTFAISSCGANKLSVKNVATDLSEFKDIVFSANLVDKKFLQISLDKFTTNNILKDFFDSEIVETEILPSDVIYFMSIENNTNAKSLFLTYQKDNDEEILYLNNNENRFSVTITDSYREMLKICLEEYNKEFTN